MFKHLIRCQPTIFHPLAVRRPSVNLCSNQIGSLTFHQLFLTFGFKVHKNITQYLCRCNFDIFAFNFNGFLIIKSTSKLGWGGGVGHFLEKKFILWDYETWFTGISEIISGVCKLWSQGPYSWTLSHPYKAQIRSNISLLLFSFVLQKVSIRFT